MGVLLQGFYKLRPNRRCSLTGGRRSQNTVVVGPSGSAGKRLPDGRVHCDLAAAGAEETTRMPLVTRVIILQ